MYLFLSETPIPSADGNCPRQNGYYAHKSVKICDKFFFCVDGQPNAITCPAGLVFNQKTGICTWPDQAAKAGCSSEGIIIICCFNVFMKYSMTCLFFRIFQLLMPESCFIDCCDSPSIFWPRRLSVFLRLCKRWNPKKKWLQARSSF